MIFSETPYRSRIRSKRSLALAQRASAAGSCSAIDREAASQLPLADRNLLQFATSLTLDKPENPAPASNGDLFDRLLSHIARRRALECRIVSVAACRSTPAQRHRMVDLVDAIEAASIQGDFVSLLARDAELEGLIAEAADLPDAGRELQQLKHGLRDSWSRISERFDTHKAVGFRAPLIGAICFRDPHGAQRAVAAFYDYLLELVEQARPAH